jgi:phosphohistidine phosphatase
MDTVYLVQHGKAHDKEVDPARPLTLEGRRETERVAELAAKLDLNIREIRHSGKTRAEETAVIFARALNLMGKVQAVSNLGPTDDVVPVAAALTQEDGPVMLVGHKPFMPRLADQLVNADAEKTAVDFHNSGIVAIRRTQQGGWQTDWQINPL